MINPYTVLKKSRSLIKIVIAGLMHILGNNSDLPSMDVAHGYYEIFLVLSPLNG